MNMLLDEWNWDEAKEVWREEVQEEERNRLLELIDQGYTMEQLKAKLSKGESPPKYTPPSTKVPGGKRRVKGRFPDFAVNISFPPQKPAPDMASGAGS
jgi:hypothetical protein